MNYYNIEIESEKLTTAVAAELLNKMGEHNLIENFSYHHSREHQGGRLSSYTRGLPNIVTILEKYDITADEIKWEDEFERAWTAIFKQYFTDLPITRKYHSILEKNVNEKTIQLDWDGKNWNELEDYFKTCWGSRSFRFEPENGVIIGIKEK